MLPNATEAPAANLLTSAGGAAPGEAVPSASSNARSTSAPAASAAALAWASPNPASNSCSEQSMSLCLQERTERRVKTTEGWGFVRSRLLGAWKAGWRRIAYGSMLRAILKGSEEGGRSKEALFVRLAQESPVAWLGTASWQTQSVLHSNLCLDSSRCVSRGPSPSQHRQCRVAEPCRCRRQATGTGSLGACRKLRAGGQCLSQLRLLFEPGEGLHLAALLSLLPFALQAGKVTGQGKWAQSGGKDGPRPCQSTQRGKHIHALYSMRSASS